MGRYFQHGEWPAADYELTGAFTEIAGSGIAFHSSGGIHLVYYRFRVLNGTAATVTVEANIRVDGIAVGGTGMAAVITTGLRGWLQASVILEIPEGLHTLSVGAKGSGAVGDVVETPGGVLYAVELTRQEASDRIEAILDPGAA